MDISPPPYVQIVHVPPHDLLLVYLNGTNYNNCTSDRDCPGDSVCYGGAPWSAALTQCACWINEHLWGENCAERWTSGFAQYILATMIVILIMYCGVLLTAATTFALTLKNDGEQYRRHAMFYSNIIFLFIAAVLGLTQVSLFLAPYNVHLHPLGIRLFRDLSRTKDISYIGIPYSFFFTVMMLNVSAMWLRFAWSVSPGASARTKKYGIRIGIARAIVYLILFILTFYFAFDTATPRATARILSATFNIVALCYIFGTFWLAYVFVRRYVIGKEFLAGNEELKDHFRLINIAARGSSAVALVYMILVAIDLGLWYNQVPTPLYDPVLIMSQILTIVGIVLMIIFAWYLFAAIHLRQRWKDTRDAAGRAAAGFATSAFDTRNRDNNDANNNASQRQMKSLSSATRSKSTAGESKPETNDDNRTNAELGKI